MALKTRLRAGHREYGDSSFGRRGVDLASELEEEALDIVGWGFVLWCRMKRLNKRLGEL
jgi:hypothetical protein